MPIQACKFLTRVNRWRPDLVMARESAVSRRNAFTRDCYRDAQRLVEHAGKPLSRIDLPRSAAL